MTSNMVCTSKLGNIKTVIKKMHIFPNTRSIDRIAIFSSFRLRLLNINLEITTWILKQNYYIKAHPSIPLLHFLYCHNENSTASMLSMHCMFMYTYRYLINNQQDRYFEQNCPIISKLIANIGWAAVFIIKRG